MCNSHNPLVYYNTLLSVPVSTQPTTHDELDLNSYNPHTPTNSERTRFARTHIYHTNISRYSRRSIDVHIPLRALLPKCNATASHVADPSFLATINQSAYHIVRITNYFYSRRVRAVRAFGRQFALELVLERDKRDVVLHGFGDLMPERRVERSGCGPVGLRAVDVARGVLVFVGRTCSVQARKGRDVGVVCVGFVDIEVARVDFVEAEPGIQVGERCDARPDPAGCEGVTCGLDGAVVGVVYHELVLVGVAKEDVCDDMRGVSLNDLIEQIGGVW